MRKSNIYLTVAIVCVVLGLVPFAATHTFAANEELPAVYLLLFEGKNIVEVNNDITTNTTWENSNIYLIEPGIFTLKQL